MLQTSVALLSQELEMRSLPRAAEVTDSLSQLARNAEKGNLAAKELLRRFYEAFDRGREATSKIQVMRS